MSLNPFSVAALVAGAALWGFTLVSVIRGRGMTRAQRILTGVVLLAAPVGIVLVLR